MKMLIEFLLLTFFSNQIFAIDLGNGSDGACTTATFVSNKKSYNCTSLVIGSNLNIYRGDQAGAGGNYLSIKVLTTVTINSTIDLSGAAGMAGFVSASNIVGGAGGAGGYAGGAGTTGNGNSGVGTSTGRGLFGLIVNSVSSYGGGGGGGSFNVASGEALPQEGDNGAAVPGTDGTNGSSYGAEATFTEATFTGGSGGGAGGAGLDGGSSIHNGSSGGGAGGAILIAAGGNITIAGSILTNGGNGGGSGATVSSGGGGGGSGGAIWLMSEGQIIITGTLSAQGSVGGQNFSGGFSGTGGDGARGRIRLDDSDGVVAGGTITPTQASSTTFSSTPYVDNSALITEYKSAVACGRVSLDDKNIKYNVLAFLFGFSLLGIFYSRSKV